MPTYDYHCSACDARVEFFQSMSEKPKKLCPRCGARKLVRQIGAGAGILFKGSGFYQTDYRSASYQESAAAESKAPCAGDTKSCAANGGPCADTSAAPKPPAKSSTAPKKPKK